MGAYYLHPPDARAIFLDNKILRNHTCFVTGVHDLMEGTNGKDPNLLLKFAIYKQILTHIKKSCQQSLTVINKSTARTILLQTTLTSTQPKSTLASLWSMCSRIRTNNPTLTSTSAGVIRVIRVHSIGVSSWLCCGPRVNWWVVLRLSAMGLQTIILYCATFILGKKNRENNWKFFSCFSI